MTDHAAEAQKHLRELQKRPATGRDDTLTALLAINHTLNAVLEAITNSTPPRCSSVHYIPALTADAHCIHVTSHNGPHEGTRGHKW